MDYTTSTMTGPIYDYEHQVWTVINTDTDEHLDDMDYITPDGVEYEISPDFTKYRNR